MPETILVVEYEPRYVDRVKQALTGLPVLVHFAKDGDEAMRLLDSERPKLIVLSSVIPRSSPAELIRQIRGRANHQTTPIVMTISGYSGKSPKTDALRFGVNDIVPKPYTDSEFRAKVQEVLHLAEGGATVAPPQPEAGPEPTVRMTSTEIFGDVLDEEKQTKKPAKPGAGTDDLDKMLADTLSGVRVPQTRKKDAAAAPAVEPKSQAAKDLDKLLHDTLSGREKPAKAPAVDAPKPAAPPVATAPAPAPEPPKAAEPARPVDVPKPAPKPVEPPKAVETPRPVAPPVAPAPPSVVEPPKPAVAADRVHLATPVLAQRAESRDDDEPDASRFGQYSMVEKIATGGMAEVWKARMRGVEGFQKTVAIKKILPHLSDNEDFVTMFVDEAKLAAQLNHNNIIHIYDLGKIANSYYIAMEYIEGHDLKTILKRGEDRGQPIPMELALFIASKIASALDYAHRKRDFDEVEMGLVHRDVSPQNVLISMEGDIKLCDFGIAKAASKASHTQAGALKGKIQYMSPEQAWGRPIDRRSDVFALAAVLFEMLSGRKLFTGDSEVSILDQVREAIVSPPSQYNDEVTPEIDAIVLKALHKSSDSRYQTAGDMARDLDAVLYSFKPTPTSADLAIYMHRLETAEPIVVPEEEPEIAAELPVPVAAAPLVPVPVASVAAPVVHEAPHPPAVPLHHEAPPHAIPAEVEARKSKALPIAAGIGVLALLGAAGAYFAMSAKKDAQPPAAQVQQASTMTAPATSAPVVPALTETEATATTTAAVPVTATAPPTLGASEQAMIDEEVRKRLTAERAKIEQQQREQQQAAQAAAQQAAAQQAAQQTPTPAPVVAQQPAQAPPPVSLAPQLQPQAAPARALREGDFVEPGTAGLIPPELVRLNKPPYPPAAKMRKVEGLVVVNALISETGRVLEVKILRGVQQNVGINEAAEQAVRESTFTPGTKDGVRVKSYKTVTIPFRL